MPKYSVQDVVEAGESATPFLPIPADEYALEVVVAEVTEPRPRQDGTMGHFGVRAQFTLTEGDYVGRSIFHRFTINLDSRETKAFLAGTYRRASGGNIKDALPDKFDEETYAQTFAAGLKGGRLVAKVGVRERKRYGVPTGEDENYIARWIDVA